MLNKVIYNGFDLMTVPKDKLALFASEISMIWSLLQEKDITEAKAIEMLNEVFEKTTEIVVW